MKLISLNTWYCKKEEHIYEYIREHVGSVDVFCIQEIRKGRKGKTTRDEPRNSYESIENILIDYTGHFSEYIDDSYNVENIKDLEYSHGIACFVKKNLKQSFVKDAKLHDLGKKWDDYSGRFAGGAIQIILVEDCAIANIHGLWQGSIKGDTEAKLEQSKRIIDLANKVVGKKIICGDFNLLPDTKSIQLLRDEYKDLIRDYKIESTRSSLYTKELRYADYMFVDKSILINSFSVPDLEISDHLPLVLEFDNKK